MTFPGFASRRKPPRLCEQILKQGRMRLCRRDHEADRLAREVWRLLPGDCHGDEALAQKRRRKLFRHDRGPVTRPHMPDQREGGV